jgi:hypothetical protein
MDNIEKVIDGVKVTEQYSNGKLAYVKLYLNGTKFVYKPDDYVVVDAYKKAIGLDDFSLLQKVLSIYVDKK